MQKTRIISQEIFDAMVDGAIEDLRKSGMGQTEVHSIIEDQFGPRYARMFCTERFYEENFDIFGTN
ncbi:MAG: hypothetical protein JRK53_20275 [Deltaproteobacteria bacterium]|nr:hypothetical protein [Deltaproteobacteria bacterium]